MGAAAALAEQRAKLPGRIVVMGCPADEIHAPGTVALGGGKLLTAAAGAWDGVDAVLYAHPEPIDTAWTSSLWMRRDTVIVAGTRDVVAGAADWAYHTPIGEEQFASAAGKGVARGIATVPALASRRLLESA